VSVGYDPYDWDVQADPYPVYELLRARAPVYRNDEKDFWALSRHADVFRALRDPDGFSNRNGVSLDASQWGPQARKAVSFLAMDPAEGHTRLRSLVASAFTRHRVASLEPRIRHLARARLAPLAEQGDFDFAWDFAAPLPMEVICELAGVPEADRDAVRDAAIRLTHREDGSSDMGEAARDAGRWLHAYYRDLAASRRSTPGDDLTSALIQARADGKQLSDQEIAATLHLLVAAGNESTGHLLTNAWQQGAAHPDARRAGLDGMAAEWAAETLRYDSSSQFVARTAQRAVRLHGTVIPEGARVILLLASANRDETVFAAPATYDLARRDAGRAVSFGGGPHYCLGAPLASMQIRVALEELGAVIADYETDTSAGQRSHWPNVRGWTSLPTRITRRPQSAARA
jgi:cytochrome P450